MDNSMITLFCFRNFQSFEASQAAPTDNYSTAGYSSSFYDPNAYAAPDPVYDGMGGNDFDNEPPLLEGECCYLYRRKLIH